VVVHERAWGFARLYDFGDGQYPGDAGIARTQEPVPMAVGTVFDLASVTKVMATTMAVMLLADRGEIDVEAPVSNWLDDFTGDGREAITVSHLLTHRSGLPQWVPVYYDAQDADAAYARIRTLSLSWPVGRERHYSDLGFMLLGRLVEEVSGRPLDVFLREELYAPMGLTGTGFRPAVPPADAPSTIAATSHGNPFERRMVHDPDFGYRIEGDPERWNGWRRYTLVGEVNDGNAHHAFGGVAGHAGLFSTAGELDVLLRLLLAEGEMRERRFLSARIVRTFLASTGDGQALGWQLPEYAPEGSFGHTGFTGTFVLGVPEHRMTVVLLTNRQNIGVDDSTQYTDVGPLQRAVTEALTNHP
jgi:CubicO group peptidase (beta-lactamase class C family)